MRGRNQGVSHGFWNKTSLGSHMRQHCAAQRLTDVTPFPCRDRVKPHCPGYKGSQGYFALEHTLVLPLSRTSSPPAPCFLEESLRSHTLFPRGTLPSVSASVRPHESDAPLWKDRAPRPIRSRTGFQDSPVRTQIHAPRPELTSGWPPRHLVCLMTP